jgi:soluble lytic murein transglycosylase-like protein
MIWWLIALGALGVLLLFTKKASGGIMSDTKEITLNEMISNYATKYNIPAALIKAVIKQESNWDINAKNPSDPSYGLMQVMPITAQDAGIITDYKNVTAEDIDKIMLPVNNLHIGCWQLNRLLKKYKMEVAVEMYNVGERGYNELNRRNSIYRSSVMSYYAHYLENPNG